MANCPFCDSDKLAERTIYNDGIIQIFPSNIPIVPGHLLMCPVRHVGTYDELAIEEWETISLMLFKMKKALKVALNAEGFNIAWNEGEVAGQTVPHFHIHILPRRAGDAGVTEYEPRKFLYRPGSRETSPDEELASVANKVRNTMETL